MISDSFITEYDRFISFCITRFAKPPIDDYKQDIYIILLEHPFHNGNIKAYIHKIVQNYFYDKFRRKKEIQNLPSLVTNNTELRLYYKDVINTIDTLPGGECVKLYSTGYKYREIAGILNLSMSRVKMNIHRIRGKLNGTTIKQRCLNQKI